MYVKKLAATEHDYLFGNSRESNAAALSLADLKKERALYSQLTKQLSQGKILKNRV